MRRKWDRIVELTDSWDGMRNKMKPKNTPIPRHMGWDGNGNEKPIPCRALLDAVNFKFKRRDLVRNF